MAITGATTTCRFTCRPGELEVRQVLIDLRRALSAQALPEDLCGSVEIAVAEALNNIVEHALPRATRAHIDVEMRLAPARLQIVLRDPGAPFPEQGLSGPALPDPGGSVEELPEGGFGRGLIHALADRVIYAHADGMNCLTLCFDMPAPGADA